MHLRRNNLTFNVEKSSLFVVLRRHHYYHRTTLSSGPISKYYKYRLVDVGHGILPRITQTFPTALVQCNTIARIKKAWTNTRELGIVLSLQRRLHGPETSNLYLWIPEVKEIDNWMHMYGCMIQELDTEFSQNGQFKLNCHSLFQEDVSFGR